MGMMDLLYRTYEYAYEAEDAQLMENYLMSQTTATAPILLWLNERGEFADAGYIPDKEKQKISIPCTEKSAGRSGKNPVPHPLFDKLLYLAGDGKEYGIDNEKAHSTYMENMEAWCRSEWGNGYVKIIFSYLNKNTLLQDLEGKGVLDFSQPKDLEKRLNECVRIGIRGEMQSDVELWKEKSIREDFGHYLNSQQEETGLCYISGEKGALSKNHPKAIWNLNANAKLISANEKDNRGFVFSGRFETSDQAVQVSYETSQKVHNALKWLIQKQGKIIGDKMLVAWGTGGSDLKGVLNDTDDFFSEEDEGDKNRIADTQREFSQRLEAAVLRQEQDLRHNEKIGFLVLEAATPGRLSVSYYQEFTPVQYSQLIGNVRRWHETHGWDYGRFDADKKVWIRNIKSPSIFSVARFAEGVERGGKIDADKKVEGNTIVRLIPCVVEGKALPGDIVRKLLLKAYYPLHYSEANWSRLLKITCSMIRTNFKEGGTMDVNRDSIDIPYNYGRWLACAHEIERRALWNAGEKRETSAMRLFTKYAEHPAKYMSIIQHKIQIYEMRLGDRAFWLQRERDKISAKLNENSLEEVVGARHLDGRMILGFQSQMEAFRNKENNKKDAGGEENEYIDE